MNILVILLIVILLCGGGWGFTSYPDYRGGISLGTVALVILIVLLLRGRQTLSP